MDLTVTDIKKLLKRGDIKQIAEELHCSESSVSMILSGKRGVKSLNENQTKILKLCIKYALVNKMNNEELYEQLKRLNND